MAEEFQTAGICGEAWWVNPARSSSSSLSPCLAAGFGLSDHHHHHMGTFLWSSNDQHMLDLKTTTTTAAATTTMKSSCEESNNNTNSVSADSSSMLFNNQKQQTDSDSGGSSSILMDSTLQMMSFPPPSTTSSTSDWNHSLLLGGHGGGDHQNNYRSMMTEDLNTQIEKEWSPKSFSCSDNNCNAVMTTNSSQGLSAGFPVNSASYGYTSALLQTYFQPEPEPAVQQSLYSNQPLMTNYMPNDHQQLSPSNWPKFAAPFSKPKQQLQQQPLSSSTGLHFSNNTPFWNASSPLNEARPPSLLPNLHYKHDRNFLAGGGIAEKRNCPTFATKYNNNEEVRDSVSAAKKVSSTEPASFKRPRIETPSPLPTFKVRKEKLGDRITALQQLVSPFGKTDTASVLHEAIDYIKFLHDQVSVLTTPYMKQGTQISQQQSCDHHNKLKDPEASKQDLKTRGLCLVPISSTFPVANETTADFWTPTFGGTFR